MAAKDDTARARLAANILNNPLFDEAIAVLREGYTQALMACPPTDNEGRWRYATAMRGLDTMKRHMATVLQRGQVSRQEVQEIEDLTVFKRAVRNLF